MREWKTKEVKHKNLEGKAKGIKEEEKRDVKLERVISNKIGEKRKMKTKEEQERKERENGGEIKESDIWRERRVIKKKDSQERERKGKQKSNVEIN